MSELQPDEAISRTTNLTHPQNPKVTVPIERRANKEVKPTIKSASSTPLIVPILHQKSPAQASADGPPVSPDLGDQASDSLDDTASSVEARQAMRSSKLYNSTKPTELGNLSEDIASATEFTQTDKCPQSLKTGEQDQLQEILSQCKQIPGHFAKATLDIAQIREELANRTREIDAQSEQDGVSIHITLLVTLMFQPASFVAAFFSSGVIHWDDDGTLSTEWVFRRDGFKLFMTLCFPMMAITFMSWFIILLSVKRKRRSAVEHSIALERARQKPHESC